MRVERFALGVCYDLRSDAAPEALWARTLSALAVGDIGGLKVYGGVACVHTAQDKCYICAFTNGSLKQMRRVYRKLMADTGVSRQLYAPRPFIQANMLASIEGMVYLGTVSRDGEITGADAPLYHLRVRKRTDSGG